MGEHVMCQGREPQFWILLIELQSEVHLWVYALLAVSCSAMLFWRFSQRARLFAAWAASRSLWNFCLAFWNHLLEPLCIVALTGCVCQSDSGLWTLLCMRWKLSPGKSTPLSRLASSLSNQSLTGCGFPQGTLRHRGYTWSVDASDGCQSSWWLTWEVSLTMLLVACSRLL